MRDRLIVALFTDRIEVNRQRVSALAASGALLRRLWTADFSIRQTAPMLAEVPMVQEKLEAATRVIQPAAVGTPKYLRPAIAFSSADTDAQEAAQANPVVRQAIEEAQRRAAGWALGWITVTPAKAGVQPQRGLRAAACIRSARRVWTPAFAGVTAGN